MNAILNFISSNVVISMVITMGTVGFLAGCWSWCVICQEHKLLNTWLKAEAERHKAQPLKDWLDKIWPAMGAQGKQKYAHLNVRLQSILDALKADDDDTLAGEQKKNNQAKERRLPTLRDLHDLTMQVELSRVWPVVFRTISSFLLILGIIGTLYGVHQNIGSETIDLKVLQPALEPSIWAVGFTVALLLLRGVYVRELDNYMARLDSITLNKLFVALLPPSKLDDAISGLSEKLGVLKKGAEQRKDITSEMEKAVNGFKTAADEFGKCEAQFKQLMTDLETTRGEIEAMTAAQASFTTNAQAALTKAQTFQNKLEDEANKIFASAGKWTAAAEKASQDWAAAAGRAVAAWETASTSAANDWKLSADNWQKKADAVLEVADALKDLPTLLKDLPSVKTRLDAQGVELTTLQTSRNELQTTLANVETKLGEVETALGKVDAQYTTLNAKAGEAVKNMENALTTYTTVKTKLASVESKSVEVGNQFSGLEGVLKQGRTDIDGAMKENKNLLTNLKNIAARRSEKKEALS